MQQANPDSKPDQTESSAGSRRSWAVIGLAVVFILVVAVSLARHQSQPKPAPPAAAAQVTITDQGFVPQLISIKPNTQLTWTNQGAKAHQVAADPYPKDDSIPGFDSSRVLQANDSYSFNFTKRGTYHVHDQLNPYSLLGTVVVR